MLIRCAEKVIRHFYNAYLAMDLKFQVMEIDYVRMTSFYIFFVAEYVYTVVLVLIALPQV